MSPQDSQETTASLPPGFAYGKDFELKELAIKATEEIIKAVYRRRKKRMPRGEALRKMAEEHLAQSIKSGVDDHIGTAAPRH